ncbi:ABC transporter ATP-binding protein [Pseudolysinimonas yzui]|uniref:ABC-type quaternary amine transporter n=1 Tax=Pseudolysinimonas yzui TaxID=2708254 RepID=A0A8J3GR39_9MICO|nr:ABC transporter ATP-binding protein [Pseudolysinimonas yzui]GHF17245.1 ABC transporter [Pseudolysinimonas yzui]
MSLVIESLSAEVGEGGERIRVLHDVSFRIEAGTLGAVLGPSGSGKSTLLRCIAGLHPTVSGTVRSGSRDLHGVPPERRRIGLVPQDGALFPHLTVGENVAFGLTRSGRRSRRVEELLDLVELPGMAGRLPHELSGGQAQRVALARALAPAPDVVLLDEPFSALDATLRGAVREQVRRALAETGTTAILVTHDQTEALSIADRLVVLNDGAVRQVGSPQEVYEHPVDLWTGRFVGEAITVAGQADGIRVTTPLGDLQLENPALGPVAVLVRPEQVHLVDGPGTAARVVTVDYFGHDALVQLDVAGGAGIRISARLATPVTLHEGDTVRIRIADRVLAYPEP